MSSSNNKSMMERLEEKKVVFAMLFMKNALIFVDGV